MNGAIIIAASWIAIVNFWHVLLLMLRKGDGRPLTISEHAVERSSLLVTHRIVHSLSIPFSLPLIYQLMSSNERVVGVLLLTGVLADSLQALSLNVRTAPLENKINPHSLSAWLMALSYLACAIIICSAASVSPWIYVTASLLCMLLLVFAITKTFKKHFLAMQMAFFVIVSCICSIAYSMLII